MYLLSALKQLFLSLSISPGANRLVAVRVSKPEPSADDWMQGKICLTPYRQKVSVPSDGHENQWHATWQDMAWHGMAGLHRIASGPRTFHFLCFPLMYTVRRVMFCSHDSPLSSSSSPFDFLPLQKEPHRPPTSPDFHCHVTVNASPLLSKSPQITLIYRIARKLNAASPHLVTV